MFVCYSFTRETLKKGDVYVRLAVSSGESVYEPHLNEREHAREPQKRLLIKSRLLSQATRAMVRTYDHEKVLNFSSCLEKSLNSTKALEKYFISLLDLEMSLKFTTLSIFFCMSNILLLFFILICTSDEIASHTQSFCKVLSRKVV